MANDGYASLPVCLRDRRLFNPFQIDITFAGVARSPMRKLMCINGTVVGCMTCINPEKLPPFSESALSNRGTSITLVLDAPLLAGHNIIICHQE